MNFGFNISTPRSIEVTTASIEQLKLIEKKVPTFKRCMNCGGCTATCSAGHFTAFNIRKIHNLYRWGQTKELEKELQKCMLCGKCTLVCPRGVNLRALIINMRKMLANEPVSTDISNFVRNAEKKAKLNNHAS